MPDPSDSSAPVTKSPEGPTPGKTPEETNGKPATPASLAEPLSLVPRARSAAKEAAAAPASAEGAPASMSDFLQWMKTLAAAAETAPAETQKPGAKLQRSILPKSQRKFQRFDREPGGPEAAGSAPVVADVPGESTSSQEEPASAGPVPTTGESERVTSYAGGGPVPIALTGGTSARRGKSEAPRSPYLWLGMQLAAILLLILSFIMGRASVAKSGAAPKNAAPVAPGVAAEGATISALSPDAAKSINEAMAVEQDRKFAEATTLLQKVQKDYPHVRDLDFRLAMLALEGNDAAKALPLLNLSIAEGEQEGAAYKLRGTILNRKKGGTSGMSDFENATLVDPFSAENFYFWGEALRRTGKPQAALVKLQQAIDRLREPALESQYRLKIRLTLIELGREQEFATEMAQQLAETPPAPDWLLTAAALELHRNNFAAAAGYLDKAATYMEKDLFVLRMRDFFFYSYRFEKSLARFFTFAATTPAAHSPSPAFGGMDSQAPAAPEATALQGATSPTPAALPTVAP